MDITAFIVQGRDKALLYGDHSTYQTQLARRLLNCRKRLGIATKNRGKFRKAEQVTAENVGQKQEYLHLLLLTSERAWAQAMSMKSTHAADQKGVIGRTRSHIISRLEKAARTAEQLVEILSQSDASSVTKTDVLEARAYASLLRGTMQFQKTDWKRCLQSYSTTRVIYCALATAGQGDIFKDLLSETVDPSIRYAAYQLKTPRTVPIPAIARGAFPRSNESLVQEINGIDPSILADPETEPMDGVSGPEGGLETLTWRSRQVKIEDAQIAAAWSAVGAAKERLVDAITTKLQDKAPHEVAAAYDEILTATQDAVDATKEAIDELKGEGVGQSDPRMQSLQITRTAVHYEMISWRIGRNRVLTGPHDGATEEYGSLRRKKKTAPAEERRERELPPSKKLAKLKEKTVLYDGTLQNLESIKELPGVAADQDLAVKIDAIEKYFISLKYLAIARSHAISGSAVNALALIHRAYALHQDAASKLPASGGASPSSLPENLDVLPESIDFLGNLLHGELQRHRAIVHVDNLLSKGKADVTTSSSHRGPLIDHLNEYPLDGVDLDKIAEFPPKMALIPVKPIFLDVAWNYIHYPGRGAAHAAEMKAEDPDKAAAAPKRSWFGFGR